jgi:hypothetical protein
MRDRTPAIASMSSHVRDAPISINLVMNSMALSSGRDLGDAIAVRSVYLQNHPTASQVSGKGNPDRCVQAKNHQEWKPAKTRQEAAYKYGATRVELRPVDESPLMVYREFGRPVCISPGATVGSDPIYETRNPLLQIPRIPRKLGQGRFIGLDSRCFASGNGMHQILGSGLDSRRS